MQPASSTASDPHFFLDRHERRRSVARALWHVRAGAVRAHHARVHVVLRGAVGQANVDLFAQQLAHGAHVLRQIVKCGAKRQLSQRHVAAKRMAEPVARLRRRKEQTRVLPRARRCARAHPRRRAARGTAHCQQAPRRQHSAARGVAAHVPRRWLWRASVADSPSHTQARPLRLLRSASSRARRRLFVHACCCCHSSRA